MVRIAAGWPLRMLNLHIHYFSNESQDLQHCKLPAHTNGYYGDRTKIKIIVIALTLSRIKMTALNDGLVMSFPSNTINVSHYFQVHGWISDESKQYDLSSSTNLAYDVKTMNSHLYSFKFNTSWVHDEKRMDFLLSLLLTARFRSDDEVSMCLYSYK